MPAKKCQLKFLHWNHHQNMFNFNGIRLDFRLHRLVQIFSVLWLYIQHIFWRILYPLQKEVWTGSNTNSLCRLCRLLIFGLMPDYSYRIPVVWFICLLCSHYHRKGHTALWSCLPCWQSPDSSNSIPFPTHRCLMPFEMLLDTCTWIVKYDTGHTEDLCCSAVAVGHQAKHPRASQIAPNTNE